MEGGIAYHVRRINKFAERKMLAREQTGRNWEINLGKNVEIRGKALHNLPAPIRNLLQGKERQTGVRDSTGRGGEEEKRKQRF